MNAIFWLLVNWKLNSKSKIVQCLSRDLLVKGIRKELKLAYEAGRDSAGNDYYGIPDSKQTFKQYFKLAYGSPSKSKK